MVNSVCFNILMLCLLDSPTLIVYNEGTFLQMMPVVANGTCQFSCEYKKWDMLCIVKNTKKNDNCLQCTLEPPKSKVLFLNLIFAFLCMHHANVFHSQQCNYSFMKLGILRLETWSGILTNHDFSLGKHLKHDTALCTL